MTRGFSILEMSTTIVDNGDISNGPERKCWYESPPRCSSARKRRTVPKLAVVLAPVIGEVAVAPWPSGAWITMPSSWSGKRSHRKAP
jgi:hypothetical protein